MKKIMFNDKFLLTKAVLDGRKTQTRRIVSQSLIDKYKEWCDNVCSIATPSGSIIETLRDWLLRKHTRYCAGEVVAVAQSYKDCGYNEIALDISPKDWRTVRGTLGKSKGWNNKMFVCAEVCKHQIRITNVRIEKLQDISDDDCLREGIRKGRCGSEDTHFMDAYYVPNDIQPYCTPQEAFAHLINKVSRKDVWQENPYVFVYDFELVK